jgi:hypothetical protein
MDRPPSPEPDPNPNQFASALYQARNTSRFTSGPPSDVAPCAALAQVNPSPSPSPSPSSNPKPEPEPEPEP